MSNAQLNQIDTRAQRIMSKVTALGFLKDGKPMVIDQAREILAAEQGFRNWHVLRAFMMAPAPAENGPRHGISDTAILSIAASQGIGQTPSGADLIRLVRAVLDNKPECLAPAKPAEAELPMHLTREQMEEALSQGWFLATSNGNVVELQIQRDDEAALLADDGAAWAFVIQHSISNSNSAAARALQVLREMSPAEYRRIEQFDRGNDRLLPYRPATSTGHPVDLAEIAEWVGIHHKVNFDSASSEAQQGWIDRFALAHDEEDRFATYLVSEGWGHIFVGKTDSVTRWVYRLGSSKEGMVCAQVQGSMGWSVLDRVATADLGESLMDNCVPHNYETEWADEVKLVSQLPSWANR